MNEEDIEEKIAMRKREIERRVEELQKAPVVDYKVVEPSMCPWEHKHCDVCGKELVVQEPVYEPEVKWMRYDVGDCYKVVRGMRLLKQSGLQGEEVRETFENASIDDFNKEVIKELRTWEPKSGRGVILSSHRNRFNPLGNGTGKSYMLHALTVKLCKEGYSCKYGRTVDFLAELRRAYDSKDGSEYDVTQAYIDCDVLLWDDLGKENIRSDWAPERFYYVIDRRITLERPIIVSTNLIPEEVREHYGADNFGPAIASRLFGNCDILYLDGPDRRLNMQL
jgi:DNA replication protein DnaC